MLPIRSLPHTQQYGLTDEGMKKDALVLPAICTNYAHLKTIASYVSNAQKLTGLPLNLVHVSEWDRDGLQSIWKA